MERGQVVGPRLLPLRTFSHQALLWRPYRVGLVGILQLDDLI